MSEQINRHIAILLRRNDCVILPGLGAFVVLHESARFDAVAAQFLPPARTLTFNPAITHDDGLLAHSLSRRMKISFEQARLRVEAEVQLLERRLQAEGAVHLPHVGTLSRAADGRPDFVADAPWQLQLPAVACVAANKQPVMEVKKSDGVAGKAVAVVRVPLHLRRLRAAAAAAILLVVGFALSTPIDLQTAHNASLAAPAFTAPEAPQIEPLPEPDGLELNINCTIVDGVVDIRQGAPAINDPYIMVVASLQSMEQANKFIAEHPGEALRVAQSGEKYRVYALSGASQQQVTAAAAGLDGFAARYPDAWVCRR